MAFMCLEDSISCVVFSRETDSFCGGGPEAQEAMREMRRRLMKEKVAILLFVCNNILPHFSKRPLNGA